MNRDGYKNNPPKREGRDLKSEGDVHRNLSTAGAARRRRHTGYRRNPPKREGVLKLGGILPEVRGNTLKGRRIDNFLKLPVELPPEQVITSALFVALDTQTRPY